MPIFVYKGFDASSGTTKKGEIEAETLKTAKGLIRQRHKVIVSSIKEISVAKNGDSFLSKLTQKKVKINDISVMTRQFATLQRAHVPIDESLRALVKQVENETLSATLSDIKNLVSEGKSLGDAMGMHIDMFSKLYVNMVKAGESSGTLGLVLERLADYLENKIATRGKIFSAISYPAIMIIASGGIIVFLFVSIVPKLTKIFDSLKVTLPWYTKLMIGISEFLQNYWYLIVIACGLGFFFFKKWLATDKGRLRFDNLLLKVPIFGPLIMRINISSFTKTLSTLLNSGVDIIQSMEITRNVIANRVIADIVSEAKVAVQEGASLSSVIDKSNRFPPLVTQMMATGEKTGQLENMLGHVADAYDTEVEQKIEGMISIIEPLMIIVMGGITVSVVISMVMPMMQIMNQIR